MKKALLLSAVGLMCASAAMAETDYTPEGYRFNNVTSFEYNEYGYGKSNIDSPVWNTINGDQYWSNDNGLVVVTGGSGYFGAAEGTLLSSSNGGQMLIAGTSIVDLGGEVGKVLAISGFNSKVEEALAAYYGDDVVIPAIDKMTGGNGWFGLNFFVDPEFPKDGTSMSAASPYYNLQCRITFNLYRNEPADGDNILGIDLVSNQNNNFNNTLNDVVSSSFFALIGEEGDPVDYDGEDSDGEYYWDPTKWMTMTLNAGLQSDENALSYGPFRLKLGVPTGYSQENYWGGLAESTLFIKSVEFYHMSKDEAVNTGTCTQTAITLCPELAKNDEGAVTTISDENANAPVNYYNLQGVRVDNPENGIFIRLQGNKAEKVLF